MMRFLHLNNNKFLLKEGGKNELYNTHVDETKTRKGRFSAQIGQSASIEVPVEGRLGITESHGNIFLSVNPRFVGHGYGLHEFIPQSLIGKKVSVRWSGEGIIIQPKE